MENEEKTPVADDDAERLWGATFKKGMDFLNGLRERKNEDRLNAVLTPEKRLLELRADVARGQRTRNFLDSTFWKEDLEPLLRGHARLKPWVPGDPLPLEEVSTLHLWNSGKVFILEVVLKQMGKWIETGDAAQKTILSDAEKRKVLQKK